MEKKFIMNEALLHELKDLYNCMAYDWDTAPASMRQISHEVLLKTLEQLLDSRVSQIVPDADDSEL